MHLFKPPKSPFLKKKDKHYFLAKLACLCPSVCLSVCLSQPQRALLSWPPRCTRLCDVVAFSIWIALRVSTESCLHKPASVTAETTDIAAADRKSDSVYRWPWESFFYVWTAQCWLVFIQHHFHTWQIRRCVPIDFFFFFFPCLKTE